VFGCVQAPIAAHTRASHTVRIYFLCYELRCGFRDIWGGKLVE